MTRQQISLSTERAGGIGRTAPPSFLFRPVRTRILAELEAVREPEERHWQRAHAPRDLLVDHCLKDDLRFKSHVMQMSARHGW